MFKKKPTEEPLTTTQEETRKSVLKDKDDNYKVYGSASSFSSSCAISSIKKLTGSGGPV